MFRSLTHRGHSYAKWKQAIGVASLANQVAHYRMPPVSRKRKASGKYVYSRKRGKYSRPKRGAGSKTLTTQHDIRTRKTGRMSMKKKRWVKFVKKVEKANHYDDSPVSLIENNLNVIHSTVNAGRSLQNIVSTGDSPVNDMRLGAYYSASAGLGRFLADGLKRLAITEVNASTRGALIASNPGVLNFWIKSCSITIAVKNVTNEVNGGYDGSDPENVYVDIYECVSRQDIVEADYRTAEKAWNNCLNDSANTLGPSALPAPSYLNNTEFTAGCTPYNAPKFGKYWKILKKTRVLIGAGAIVNTVVQGWKGKINWGQFSENLDGTDKNLKGKVKDFIIVVDPTFNVATTRPVGKNILEIQWTKNFHVGYDGLNPMQSVTGHYSY